MENDNKRVDLVHGNNAYTVLICTTDEGASVGKLIHDALVTKKLNVGYENLSKSNAVCSVRQCTVFVPILSPQMEQTSTCQAAFEEARRLRKPIVPVIAIEKWKPEDWLGLTIGGCQFFRIFDKEGAYKPFYDSYPMANLCVAVEVSYKYHFGILFPSSTT